MCADGVRQCVEQGRVGCAQDLVQIRQAVPSALRSAARSRGRADSQGDPGQDALHIADAAQDRLQSSHKCSTSSSSADGVMTLLQHGHGRAVADCIQRRRQRLPMAVAVRSRTPARVCS